MTKLVSEAALVGKGTTFGDATVVMEGVVIGENCLIGCGVIIHTGTCIGSDVRIDDGAILGKSPMRAPLSALTEERGHDALEIGEGCLIGARAVLYEGSRLEREVLVADLATIREDVVIGERTIVGRGVSIENRVTIGSRCKIESNAYICGLSEIGDDCFIAPGVITTNDNFLGRTKERFKYHKGITMKRGSRIGAGAVILPGVVIGEEGVVAAGSVVTRDVSPRVIVAGTPARYFRDVPPEQLLENQ